MATWAIGDVTVIRIEEQIGFASRAPEDYLDGFEREVLARHLDWLCRIIIRRAKTGWSAASIPG